MMHKASWGIENEPYYFSRSSIKFQRHTVWKIDDFNPIWVWLLGRSQLSNISHFPCLFVELLHEFVKFVLLIADYITYSSVVFILNFGIWMYLQLMYNAYMHVCTPVQACPIYQRSWGQHGADQGPVGPRLAPMLAPWTFLSGVACKRLTICATKGRYYFVLGCLQAHG